MEEDYNPENEAENKIKGFFGIGEKKDSEDSKENEEKEEIDSGILKYYNPISTSKKEFNLTL